ncbi:MAG: hypothetical protein A4E42_02174 [Methanoregulaceae archaeon PtaU1.Bin222]|nr:MAG: hypothetical protein A4E42_02174 [Methanoregulaceae archaeon PtaU1.Bin222]
MRIVYNEKEAYQGLIPIQNAVIILLVSGSVISP